MKLLHETFPGCVLSRFDDQIWPPRSCALKPLDFFLWGLYLKSKVYVHNPTITHLLEEIKRFNEIQPQLCRKV